MKKLTNLLTTTQRSFMKNYMTYTKWTVCISLQGLLQIQYVGLILKPFLVRDYKKYSDFAKNDPNADGNLKNVAINPWKIKRRYNIN